MGAENPGERRSRMADRPGLGAHHLFPIAIPRTWPERWAFRAGVRLFAGAADEVPMLLRQGIPIDQYLEPPEVDARLELGQRAFERWFRLGWSRAAGEEES